MSKTSPATAKPIFRRTPLAARIEKLASGLIPEGWYDAIVTSVDLTVASTGNEGYTMALKVQDPLFGGRTVYLASYATMTKSRDNHAERFPGVNFNDGEDVSDALLGEVVRAHVVIQEKNGEYAAKNRVVSIGPKLAR